MVWHVAAAFPTLHHLNAISALQPTPLLHRVAFLVRIQSERKRRRRRRCRQRLRRCVSSVGCSLRLTSRHRSGRRGVGRCGREIRASPSIGQGFHMILALALYLKREPSLVVGLSYGTIHQWEG